MVGILARQGPLPSPHSCSIARVGYCSRRWLRCFVCIQTWPASGVSFMMINHVDDSLRGLAGRLKNVKSKLEAKYEAKAKRMQR